MIVTIRISLATLALVALAGTGVVLGSLFFWNRHFERSALQPYDSGWGGKPNNLEGWIAINFINEPKTIRGGPRFSYWTGGYAQGEQPLSPPTQVVAAARQGLVEVEVKAEAQAPRHAAIAAAVARHIDVATTTFWPGEQMPVAVELHQVPVKSRYEFARKITWREGRPFHLTLFIVETDEAQEQAEIAVHELFHVITTRWQLGSKSKRAVASPWLGSLLEEVAASLLITRRSSGSPHDGAQRLLNLCHKAIRDPWQLESHFRNLIGGGA